MPKMSKEKDEEEKPTVSTVFETLKSKQILRNFFWEVLSELKEKPTFKHIKEIVNEVLNEKKDVLDTLPVNKYGSDAQKSIVSDICTMAYTVDTFYSKILYHKLEHEFTFYVYNVINALRSEGKIPDDVWSELEIPKISFDKNIKEAADSTEKTAVPKETASPVATSTAKKQLPEKSNCNDEKETGKGIIKSSTDESQEDPIKSKPVSLKKGKQKVTCNKNKKLENKNAPKNDTEGAKELPQSKMETRSHAVRKKTLSPVATYTHEEQLPGKCNSESIKEIEALLDAAMNENSDAESVVSLASVSSVHTSDLSSFDDEVSVSSDDEGAKRKVSLKALVDQKVAGKFNGFKKKTQKSEQGSCHGSVHKTTTAQASVQPTDKADESATSELLSTSYSSKRVRKPNSKYSSDTIICQQMKVKDRKKSNVSATNTDEKLFSENSPKKKRTFDTEPETRSKVQKTDVVPENNSSDPKNPSKENKSSDLPKPVSVVRPLTSRRTAPLTLFSSKP